MRAWAGGRNPPAVGSMGIPRAERVMEILGVLLAVTILAVPVVVLVPLVDRLFEIAPFRVLVRRIFRIDPGATLANLPEPGRRAPRPWEGER